MIQFPIVRTREKDINRGSVTCHKGGCVRGGQGRMRNPIKIKTLK